MKKITIEVGDNGLSTMNINMENANSIHLSVMIAELENAKLMMIGQRSKMTGIKK